jgi:hypothetical protein
LLGLADLDAAQVGEDGGEEQVGQGVDGFVHERILSRDGIGRRITGEWAMVMGRTWDVAPMSDPPWRTRHRGQYPGTKLATTKPVFCVSGPAIVLPC